MTDNPSFLLSQQQADAWRQRDGTGELGQTFQIAVRLDAQTTITAVERAVASAVGRHEILRTTYAAAPGRSVGVQTVRDELGASVRAMTGTLDQVFAAERRPFALDESPLRIAVLGIETADAILVVTLAAIAGDGDSVSKLTNEILANTSVGGAIDLDEPLQYADYAAWQEDVLASETAPGAIEAWVRRTAPDVVLLPFQSVDTTPVRTRSAIRNVSVDVAAIAQCAVELKTKASVVIEAAWVAWLARATQSETIVVQTLFDGRSNPDIAGATGPFGRYGPMRVACDGETEFADLVRAVDQSITEGEALQEFVEASTTSAARWNAISPAFTSVPSAAGSLRYEADPPRFSVELRWLGDRLELCARLPDDIARSFAQAFGALVDHACEQHASRLDSLQMVRTEHLERAIAEFNDTEVAPREGAPSTFLAAIAAQIALTPDRVAVGAGHNQLSYRELDARANQVARALAQRGVVRGSTVGLLTDRSPTMMVGILGILKAGAAYVPLNPEHPQARLAFQLEETNAAIVVATAEYRGLVPQAVATLIADDESLANLERTPVATELTVAADDGAYVLYTSGSTGTPKGVLVTHANLVNYAVHVAARLESIAGVAPGSGLRCGVVTAISTDLGNTCIMPPLVSGGRVELIAADIAMDPFRFATHIAAHPIDVLKITPSHFAALFNSVGIQALPKKLLVFGGEASSWDTIERVREVAPSLKMLNHYGPTETTVGACTFDVSGLQRSRQSATVPIGGPIANTTCDVVDSTGRPVPIGIPGELMIGGRGVAHGYVAQPSLTSERFLTDPLRPGSRIYRTGDLVRRLPDGTLEFLGRVDDQVKIRGHRVEPREVAQMLSELASIRQAAVVAREFGPGDVRLVAYLVCDTPIDATALRAAVAAKLPEVMIPSAFVPIEKLPLSPSGKLDRKALPDPESVNERVTKDFVAPRTSTEVLVAEAWIEVLGLVRVGVDEDFFALGGHSLLATQVIARIRHAIGIDLPLHALFIAPTIAGFATLVDEMVSAGGVGDEVVAGSGIDDELAALLDGMTDEEIARLLGDG